MSNYKFLSFCNIPDLEDNSQKAVSPLGELSTRARTYDKFPAVYKSKDSVSALVTFSGTKDDQYATMPVELQTTLLGLTDWIYSKATANSFSNDKASALKLITTNYPSPFAFTSIGEMVTNSIIWLPAYIEGTYQLNTNDTVTFKIWFANANFLAEYPYCDISVVLPLADSAIDTLATGNYQQIAGAISEETQDRIEKRVIAVTNNIPYTDRLIYSYPVYDTVNASKTNTVYFIVLTNGNSADASDQIILAIQKALLAVTKQSETVWGNRIPDLFNPMQFTCIPGWDKSGVENKTSGGSLYSPVTDYETSLNNIKRYLPSVTGDALIKSTQFLPSLYKSLNVAYVGSGSNREGIVKINNIFKDIMLIPSTDSQAAWMNDATSTFLQQMENLLAGAESLTPDSVPPTGIKRVTQNDVLYASMKIGQVNFLVVTRYQFVKDGLIDS